MDQNNVTNKNINPDSSESLPNTDTPISAPPTPDEPVPTESNSSTSASSPSAQKPSLFRRFKSLFAKENPHHRRNRSVLGLSSVAAIGLVIAIIVFQIAPTVYGKIAIVGVEPTKSNNGIVDADSHFLINTENGTIDKVRNAIYVEPAIDYEIKEVTPGTKYEMVPASKLVDNTVFNIDSISNEVVAYKWAFQTKKDLSVSKIYPANGANYVSENTVIEFSFSYPDVENVADHFSISPQVTGNLEKLERSWRFTPDVPLAKDTTYEITISAGLSYGEEIMTTDYHSSFSTFAHAVASSDARNAGITLDNVSYFTDSETPVVVFENGDRESFDNSEYVSIEKINSADDFIKHLNGEQITGETIGDYDFRKINQSNYALNSVVLNQTLPVGYYVLHFKASNGQNLYTADIEVNNLSAYAFESERDLVVWTAENGELQSGVKVNFRNQDYETGENGLLTIKDISNYSNELEYLKVGNTEQPLVIAVKDFKNDIYPNGFIYTDRPLYAPNDTIKIWGYVPLSFFKDSPNLKGFSLKFDEIKQPIEVDTDGFFSSEIKLDNYKDISDSMLLTYNDVTIARRYISVENYTLENYTYEFISSKNYVNAGEDINFAIRVSHITGFPAINKDIVVTYNDHDYYATTNGQGLAEFTFPTEYSVASWEYPSPLTVKYITVKSGGAEYNKYSTGTTFYIFKTNLSLQGSKTSDGEQLKFTAKELDLSADVKADYNFTNLPQSNYSGTATLRLYEDRHQRTISGYYYNEYTKENTPNYYVNTTTSIIDEVTVEFVNGELTYTYPTNYKDPEENVSYSYWSEISAIDSSGRPAYSYKNYYYMNNYLGSTGNYNYNAIMTWGYNPTASSLYALYRFGLKDTTGTSPYSIGDTLKLGLYDYSGAIVENTGEVLAVVYQESLIDTKTFSDNTIELSFSHDLYPGVEVAGAYFKDGKFYRIAPSFFDYDEKDSELTVNIETDNTSYAPGDTVKGKVIVTHPDGSRANGVVNLSVVNEAIFSAGEDNTSILSSIYANKQFKSYSMSTFRDLELFSTDGRGGVGGGRSDFGDTIFFGSNKLSNGEAEFEFKLNDSITSFRLTAIAVENGDTINAGVGTAKITSSLPLSISTIMPKKVKNTDDLVLNATSITSAGDSIEYTFTVEELDKTLTASAIPGQTVTVNFGKLDLGTYTVVIAAQDSAGNTDKMTYPIEIIETAQEVTIKDTIEIDQEGTVLTPVKNPIIVELYDEETKDYITYLDFLEDKLTSRLDTITAYYKSQEYRDKYYNEEAKTRVPNLDVYLNNNGTLKPLENAEGDYVLTALVNYYMPNYFNLDPANYGINLEDDNSTVIQKLLVLASFKEPVLLELRSFMLQGQYPLSDDEKAILGIALAFIGDYDSAKQIYVSLYNSEVRQDLLAILSSFVYKNNTTDSINRLIAEDPSIEYLPFAIISFFDNNEVDLAAKSTVDVVVNSVKEQIEIHPLEVAKKVYYSNGLSDISIASSSDDIFASYYYQGGISSLSEAYVSDISTSLENIVVGQTGNLVIDISAIPQNERNGILNVALPSSLKYSASFSGEDGLYLERNNNEYIRLSLSDRYANDTITIPLYVGAPGNYEMEPIIFSNDEGYHISNSIVFDVQ